MLFWQWGIDIAATSLPLIRRPCVQCTSQSPSGSQLFETSQGSGAHLSFSNFSRFVTWMVPLVSLVLPSEILSSTKAFHMRSWSACLLHSILMFALSRVNTKSLASRVSECPSAWLLLSIRSRAVFTSSSSPTREIGGTKFGFVISQYPLVIVPVHYQNQVQHRRLELIINRRTSGKLYRSKSSQLFTIRLTAPSFSLPFRRWFHRPTTSQLLKATGRYGLEGDREVRDKPPEVLSTLGSVGRNKAFDEMRS